MRSPILFLSQCLPYPPHSGVTNRTFHILVELQREFDVTLIAFSRRNHQPDERSRRESRAELVSRLKAVHDPVPLRSETSRLTRIWNHGRSVLGRRPYVFYDYGSRRFGDQIRAAIGEVQPDLIHLDSLDLYRWLGMLPDAPVACTHHSIESDLLRRRARQIPRPWLRWYLRHQADLLERVERRECERVAVNVMMSDADATRLSALAPKAKLVVVPNGVDTDYFSPAAVPAPTPGRVVFLGPTYMFPNRDAVGFFLAAVWPRVREGFRGATLHLVGRTPPADRERFEAHEGVTVQGYVPDVRPHLADACCSVVPLRVGGGTRLKILDAWAMGTPVVSTTIGCEGLQVVDGENILVRDDPGEFAEAVVRVLTDPALRSHLAANGRRTAEERYGWEAIGTRLRECYRDLIGRANPWAARPGPPA